MTALTKTISNTLKVYSPEPTTKWNYFLWGGAVWGYTDIPWSFNKLLQNTATLSTSQGKQVTHYLGIPMTVSLTLSKEFPARFFDTLMLGSRIASIYVINNGWYVAKGGEINALNWPRNGFSEITGSTTTWTEVSQPSTTWVQA